MKWQIEWDTTDKGRETYARCKNFGIDRLPLTFKGVQLVTGHGNFSEYLLRFGFGGGKVACKCGFASGSLEHVLSKCALDQRARGRAKWARNAWQFRVGNEADAAAVSEWN